MRSLPGLVWLLFGLAALPAAPDTIILKNGRRIVANEVREEGSRVSYETEDGTYSFPRSLVERIEKQEGFARPAAPRRATTTLLPPILPSAATEKAPVLSSGELDHKSLERMARQTNLDKAGRRRLAAVFLAAIEYQMRRGRTDHAIRAWRKSLSLAPDSGVEHMLERAQRETVAEAHYEQASSGHFTLRFEGRQVAPAFRREILQVLERHYQELDRQLDASLREPIAVILYTDQAFRDVTRAPSWAGALNNGRMRIPVEGLSSVTPQLSAVLKHELVHSLVWAKTKGRCPAWLNEGLAQVLEGSSVRGNQRLAKLWMAGQLLPWPGLEESFVHLGPGLAAVAYAQSLAATEFLVRRHGMHELERLLEHLANGQPIASALNSVHRLDYQALNRNVGKWLRDTQ